MELAVLQWALVFAVITAGAYFIARSVVQIASVAYARLERRITAAEARRQGVLYGIVILVAIGVTAFIAALAMLVVLGGLLQQAPQTP